MGLDPPQACIGPARLGTTPMPRTMKLTSSRPSFTRPSSCKRRTLRMSILPGRWKTFSELCGVVLPVRRHQWPAPIGGEMQPKFDS